MAPSGLLFLLLAILIHLFLTTAQPKLPYFNCSGIAITNPSSNSGPTSYLAPSFFPENLNLTFSYLLTNATHGDRFYNTSTGQGSDEAYGLFLCRGDVSPVQCQSCVEDNIQRIQSDCPNRTAVLWDTYCMLRYADRSIFSLMEESPQITLNNERNVSDPDGFNATLMSLMDSLVMNVSPSSNMFATGEVELPAGDTLYALVQCTPDISLPDCKNCLSGSIQQIPICCGGKQGGIVLRPSCNIRYENYTFLMEAAAAPGPSYTSPPALPIVPAPAPAPAPATSGNSSGKSSRRIIVIVVPTMVSPILVSTLCYCFVSRKARKKHNAKKQENVANEITTVQFLQFELGIIKTATNNFSNDNKIGEGGFGSVYKGILPKGQQIAVKRLSRGYGQGAQEFKNEVALVAKLQHKYLVRLLGFCPETEEMILVYEFVPNKSLDYFLFDPKKRAQLDWSTRYKIIGGIARGMLYLHEDSRLKVIHRDLKAGNILLDGDMNPKVADFGTARIFGVDQTQERTNKIAGTHGYMSPEYVMSGRSSVKSDVFSFGVLVLEIVTGKRNSDFYRSDNAKNLLNYAWKHWKGDTPLELMDPNLTDSYVRNEIVKCIHIGLSCVEEDSADRPIMASIVHTLNSLSVTLPLPRQPAFLLQNRIESNMPERESNQSTSHSACLSVNEMSITELYPR